VPVTKVDVTVLGGGPAGCAAALALAARGHSVIVVEALSIMWYASERPFRR
jgi:flavin-dependent dehydrogenase